MSLKEMWQEHDRPLHVVVIGFNRPASLARLLHSLEQADYGGSPRSISIVLALDQPSNRTIDCEIDALAHGFRWPHGELRVRRRRKWAGLRDNVLGAWVPTSDDSPPAVFLEDDVEVSPLWWHWVQAAMLRYATPAALADGLIGISLFTPDELNEPYRNRGGRDACGWQARHARSHPVGARLPAVRWAQPCSWGALYFAGAWRLFLAQAASLRMLDKALLPQLPCPPDVVALEGASCQVEVASDCF